MLTRNLTSSVMLVIGSMTSCQSFLVSQSGAFVILPLYSYDSELPEPEASRELAIRTETTMGIDQDFITFPHRDYTAPDVVQLCMDKMARNDEPYKNAGQEVCFNFSSDRCRAAQGGSLEMFIQFANNPVFASMVNALDWSILSTGPIIPGTPTRGAMQTVLVNVKPEKGNERKFLWTLQQERRPPRQGCWLVYECIDVGNAYSLTL